MLLGKVVLRGEMELKTGLHVGASRETMKIGGIDSPVVRDPITDFPYIPGSSLKGKMRSLWEQTNKAENRIDYNLKPPESPVQRHECEKREAAESCIVCRIFGSAKGGFPSRVIVRDLHLTEKSKGKLKNIDTGLKYTEWKFENVIDRITAKANPRQIERVPAGSKFGVEIIYNIENKEQVEEDLRNVEKCMQLLQDDYLGGQGSRGYGKVEFRNLKVEVRKIGYYLEGKEEAKREFDKVEDAVEFVKRDEDNKTEL